jgi:hypothetical protein
VLRHLKSSAESPQGEEEAMRLGRLHILPGAGRMAQVWSWRIAPQNSPRMTIASRFVADPLGKIWAEAAGKRNDHCIRATQVFPFGYRDRY